ncbi:unnamed protein product [Allacma fusca]|uniref:Uncharacterized protein n=1 Tax=Allacma fusca TaxID=39272 RepID=A0A8J2KFF1_9HEXA|nr:unnamed protein product [Allacma fusca]
MKRRKDSRVFLLIVLIASCHISILNAVNLNAEIVNIALDFDNSATALITLDSNTTETEFDIFINSGAPPDENSTWKLNLVVEEMNAGPDLNCSSETSPHITLDYDFGGKKVIICDDFDHSNSDFHDITVFSANHTNIKITTSGNWDTVTAQIVVTIYYETNECSSCRPGTFCCDGKRSSCKGSLLYDDLILGGQVDDSKPRCIHRNLTCNSHANCGMTCNADESEDTCVPKDECHSHPSGCYWEAGFFWTAVLAVVFFVMAPTVIVFLICYHKQVNTLNSRRRGGPVTVSSPPNDLPPTYDELAAEDPPPCFCSVISTLPENDTQDGGVDNTGFEPEARTGNQSFTCVCGGNKTSENGDRSNN